MLPTRPSWSVDGSELLYARLGGGISVVGLQSGDTRVVTDGADFSPTWSHSGTSIAFERHVGGNSLVYVSEASGAGAHPLDECPKGVCMQEAPSWSATNRAVAFVEDGQLLVANLDGVATAVALPEQF